MSGNELLPMGRPRLGRLVWIILGLLLIWQVSTPLALLAIAGYQRFVSPHKGWRCAHAVLHGGRSCSCYGKEVIAQRGVLAGVGLLWGRFDACREASTTIRARAGGDSCGQACEKACEPYGQAWDDFWAESEKKAKEAAEKASREAEEAAKKAADEAFKGAKDAFKDVHRKMRRPLIELKAPWSETATITQGNKAPLGYSHRGASAYAVDFGKSFFGREVLAAADGTVVSVLLDPKPSKTDGGTTLTLKHQTRSGEPVYTVYGHLSEVKVKLDLPEPVVYGRKIVLSNPVPVVQGQVIALGGDTGTIIKGAHLHFYVTSTPGGPSVPIDALILKKVPGDDDFRPYYSDLGDLDHDKVVGEKPAGERTFESNNERRLPQ